jgi:hypothetical protein
VLNEGAFFKVFFPTKEKPREPGLSHICYCLAVRPPLALVAYTTSVPWPEGIPLTLGVKLFTKTEAAGLNQNSAFRLHLNRQARIPLNKKWVPEIDTPHQGVIATASSRLRQELYEITLELQKRHEQNIERLGL